jgi:hypothetical protein
MASVTRGVGSPQVGNSGAARAGNAKQISSRDNQILRIIPALSGATGLGNAVWQCRMAIARGGALTLRQSFQGMIAA